MTIPPGYQRDHAIAANGSDPAAAFDDPSPALQKRYDNIGAALEEKGKRAQQSEKKKPKPIPGYKPYPIEVLPESLQDYVRCASRAIGVDPCMIALPMISELAAAIGTTRAVRVKRSWSEPAIIWTGIVIESGSKKTPAFDTVLKPIRRAERKKVDEHEENIQVYEEQVEQYKKSKSPDAEKPTKPTCTRYTISDITTEAVAERLHENPRGLLLTRDELSGWFGDLDRYAQSKGGDAPRWLSIWSGSPIVVDRKQTGATHIHRPAVSITGTVQPEVFERVIGNEHIEDGMAARFLLAMPPDRPAKWSDADIPESVEGAFAAIVKNLINLEHEQDDDGHPRPMMIGLDEQARARYITWHDKHAERLTNESGAIRAALAKMQGYVLRLALVLHLAEQAGGGAVEDAIDQRSIDAAIRLVEWHAGEAERVYGMFAESEDDREHRRLIEWIEGKGGSVTARDVTRNLRAYPTTDDAKAALNALAEAGYGEWQYPGTGNHGGNVATRFILCSPPTDSADADTCTADGTKNRANVGVGSVGGAKKENGRDEEPPI